MTTYTEHRYFVGDDQFEFTRDLTRQRAAAGLDGLPALELRAWQTTRTGKWHLGRCPTSRSGPGTAVTSPAATVTTGDMCRRCTAYDDNDSLTNILPGTVPVPTASRSVHQIHRRYVAAKLRRFSAEYPISWSLRQHLAELAGHLDEQIAFYLASTDAITDLHAEIEAAVDALSTQTSVIDGTEAGRGHGSRPGGSTGATLDGDEQLSRIVVSWPAQFGYPEPGASALHLYRRWESWFATARRRHPVDARIEFVVVPASLAALADAVETAIGRGPINGAHTVLEKAAPAETCLDALQLAGTVIDTARRRPTLTVIRRLLAACDAA